MEGIVYNTYTPIEGVNMMADNDAGVNGSVQIGESGATGTIWVKWSLPGGMQNTGSFGYIFGDGQLGESALVSDEKMQEMVDKGEITEAEIQEKMEIYIAHVLGLDPEYTNPNLGWTYMLSQLKPLGCAGVIY